MNHEKDETECLKFDWWEGGFYAFLVHAGGLIAAFSLQICDALATAQTGNMMSAILAFETGASADGWAHVLGTLLYAVGLSITILVPPMLQKREYPWERLCLVIEIGLLLLVPCIPVHLPPALRGAPIFLAGALQFNSFTACNGVPLTTLFCTNTFRQLIINAWEFRKKQDPMVRRRLVVYGGSIVIFMSGVAIGFPLVIKMEAAAIYAPCGCLLAALLLKQTEKIIHARKLL